MSEKQFGRDYYDRLYEEDTRNFERALTSPYYPLYRKVVGVVRQEGLRSVLEVGCGSGVLAEMLIADGLAYDGFDFSPVAVDKALARNPEGRFYVGDASDPACYQL